jgi:CBS domain-containing protein
MLRLRDIMTTDVISVSPDTTLREAMELLTQRHVSGAPVVSGERVVGVVTATDLMAFASTLSGVPTERAADDALGVWGDTSLVDDSTGREQDPSSTFFSQLWDDVDADVTTRIANAEGPEWNALEEHDVSEVMSTTPLAVLSPDADVSAAAAVMSERGIHRVLVTEGDRLVGIVSTLDITRAAAEHRLTTRTYLFNRDGSFASDG